MEDKKVIRSSSGLRDVLFDEIDSLRNGESNPARATALAKLSVQIINSVTMEIQYNKYLAAANKDGGQIKEITRPELAIPLGSGTAG